MEIKEWVSSIKKIRFHQILLVIFGAILSSVAIQIFVRPADLVPSGISGLSILLIKEITSFNGVVLPYGIVYLGINIIVLALVYKHLGKRFLILSLLHIFLTSIIVDSIPEIIIVDDPMLLAIFGGAVNACGSLVTLYAGASTGGLDFVAMAYARIKNKPLWNYVLIFNIILLTYAGARYNWQMALYSIIYQFISMRTIDTYHNRFKLSRITIITNHGQEVAKALYAKNRHGITSSQAEGMYLHESRDMLYLVVNEYQVNGIIREVNKVDPKAFMEISKVERIIGNYYQDPIE